MISCILEGAYICLMWALLKRNFIRYMCMYLDVGARPPFLYMLVLFARCLLCMCLHTHTRTFAQSLAHEYNRDDTDAVLASFPSSCGGRNSCRSFFIFGFLTSFINNASELLFSKTKQEIGFKCALTYMHTSILNMNFVNVKTNNHCPKGGWPFAVILNVYV